MVSHQLLHVAAARAWVVTLTVGMGDEARSVTTTESAPTALQAVWAAKENSKVDGSSLTGFDVKLVPQQ